MLENVFIFMLVSFLFCLAIPHIKTYFHSGSHLTCAHLKHHTKAIHQRSDWGNKKAEGDTKDWKNQTCGNVDIGFGAVLPLSRNLELHHDSSIMPSHNDVQLRSKQAITGTIDDDRSLFKHNDLNLQFITSQQGTFPVFSRFERTQTLTRTFSFLGKTCLVFKTQTAIRPFLGFQSALSKFKMRYEFSPIPPLKKGFFDQTFEKYEMGFGPIAGLLWDVDSKLGLSISAGFHHYFKQTHSFPIVKVKELSKTLSVTHYPRYWHISCAFKLYLN